MDLVVLFICGDFSFPTHSIFNSVEGVIGRSPNMILCFVAGLGTEKNEIDLCLVPEKPDSLAVPVRVRDLFPTVAGFQRIGPDEGVAVSNSTTDDGIVVAALPPGGIFLTPNLPNSPGFRVRRIKILLSFDEPSGAPNYRTFYERDGKKEWEEWVANRERREE